MINQISLLTGILFSFLIFSTPNLASVPDEVIETTTEISKEDKKPISFEERVKVLYDEFSSLNSSLPSLAAFQKAMKGYSKLSENGEIKNKILSIADFSLPSSEKRLWIMNMDTKKVLFHTFVAHGKNTGLEMAENFSNTPNSYQSSLGFYVTGETYYGKNGLSLFIDGKEEKFNSNARERYVVIHGADYATPQFVQRVGRLGRSYGCPALPSKLSKEIIETIKGKSCFFIYFPSEKYLTGSAFLNTPVA